MRSLAIALIAALVLAAGFVRAQERRTDDAIHAVITRQIEAFRRDDAETAFAIAAPSIQKRFGSPDVFIAMVAQGYPQVYRPQSFSFAERVRRGRATFQKVVVVGPDGVAVAAVYELIEVNGAWRINGCQIAKLPGQDV